MTPEIHTEICYIIESFSDKPCKHDDEFIPAGWQAINSFRDIDWDEARKLVARRGWRVVKETITREVILT